MKTHLALFIAFACLGTPALADQSSFSFGPAINDFGAIAKVDTDVPLPANSDYKIVFDLKSAKAGERSTGLDAVARLMNMLAANGVPMSKIHPAVVLHNDAVWEVVTDARYGREVDGKANPSAPLVKQLLAKGVPIYICGQSMAWLEVSKSDLLPGVKVALSAMTAHQTLRQQGYALNPF